jgi:Bacterial SH3 domain
MKFLSIKALWILPILTLSVAPAAIATTMTASQAASAKETLQVAQMVQIYCTIAGNPGGIGVNVYDAPSGGYITRLPNDETVAFNSGDRSGDWAEVTDSNGTTGWVETQHLSCDTPDMSSEETTDESYYEEAPDDSFYYEESEEVDY